MIKGIVGGETLKILFVSDIHGSLYYARKGIEALNNEEADYIVLLGDLLYHGARNPLPKDYNPGEVANLLNKFADKIIAEGVIVIVKSTKWCLISPYE